jgi:asparagine synthetase B (glutamine-hydrolysing)
MKIYVERTLDLPNYKYLKLNGSGFIDWSLLNKSLYNSAIQGSKQWLSCLRDCLDGDVSLILVNYNNSLTILQSKNAWTPVFINKDNGNYYFNKLPRPNPKNISTDKVIQYLQTGSLYTDQLDRGLEALSLGHAYFYDHDTKKISKIELEESSAIVRNERFSEIVENLDCIIENIIRKLTYGRRVGVLLSGGADSRIIAKYATMFAESCVGYTYGDPLSLTSELKITKNIANHLGINLKIIQRSHTHYEDCFKQFSTLSYGNLIDFHHPNNLPELIKRDGIEILLTGCYFDYLLKGLIYSREAHEIAGRSMPTFKFTTGDEFYHGTKFTQEFGNAKNNFVCDGYDGSGSRD